MAVIILQLVGLGVLGLGVILHIVGTATPAWITPEVGDYEIGLFKTCYDGKCTDTPENTWIRNVKALTLTGVVLSLLAGLLAVVAIVLRKRNPYPSNMPSVFSLVLCLLAGLLIFIGVIIFGVKVFSQIEDQAVGVYFELGYSFGLCITGGILIIIGGAMTSAVCLEKPNNNQTMGATSAVQNPPMMYQPQAGGMMYHPQAGGMVYQPQAGGMVYQPQAGGMVYQPQAGGMVYQPQAGGMVYPLQTGGMSHLSATTKENGDAK